LGRISGDKIKHHLSESSARLLKIQTEGRQVTELIKNENELLEKTIQKYAATSKELFDKQKKSRQIMIALNYRDDQLISPMLC